MKRPSSSIENDPQLNGRESDHPSKKLDVKITSPTAPAPTPAVVHPFFSSKPITLGNFLPSPPTIAHFLHLDPFPSLGESSTRKIEMVFYDLDGTLIKTKNGGSGFPTSRTDWSWWDISVPAKLKREWEEGKHLVVLSNQGDGRPKVRGEWKAKLPLIAAKVCPLYLCISCGSLIGANGRCLQTPLSVS